MNNIDVFLCSIENADELRMGFAQTCEARWLAVEGSRVCLISDRILGCSEVGFQRMRRIFADENATSDIYVVADDDCLLPAEFDLEECVRIFKESGFATLSLMPSNANIVEWTPEDYIPESTPDVMEHISAGGIRFCRKGHLKEWPPMGSGPGYDAIHGEAIRTAGGRVGYFRSYKMLHLGEGFSSIWVKETATA